MLGGVGVDTAIRRTREVLGVNGPNPPHFSPEFGSLFRRLSSLGNDDSSDYRMGVIARVRLMMSRMTRSLQFERGVAYGVSPNYPLERESTAYPNIARARRYA